MVDIPVAFSGNLANQIAVADFAFASIGEKMLLILASGGDNNIALVDMNSPSKVTKLALTSASESSGAASDGRSVEWAIDTEYVWITGSEAEEMYIVQVPNGEVTRGTVHETIKGIDATALVYVENYASKTTAMQLGSSQSFAAAAGVSNQARTTESIAIAGLVIAVVALVMSVYMAVSKMTTPTEANKSVASSARPVDEERAEQPVDLQSLGSKQVN